jgi:two-component sensor histidine kinase
MTISDNGSGFDVEKFSHSNSLGVTLIKTLSQQLKGEFEILESSESSGSIFRIEFKQEK